jgi:hypothetical protein
MELVEFYERIYGKYNNQLFIFETAWDSFRPISYVGWNGTRFEEESSDYKQNIFSPYYGYGTAETKQLCKELTNTTELSEARPLSDPVVFWKWCGQQGAVWWFDRPAVFLNKCSPRTRDSWKRYIQFLHVKPKTLRRSMIRRATKRLVPK